MKNSTNIFDVIIVGGGHAGIEAAHAAATLGSKTILITLDTNKIGLMPCNPAIGGVGKGHIVYEVSALGGLMPKLCTTTYLQARMLNTRKGSAVQGLRLQIDKEAYNTQALKQLAATPHLTLLSDTVDDIILNAQGQVSGVITTSGTNISAPTVVITTGTFLNGRVHVGKKNHAAGRRNEPAVAGLSRFFSNHDLKLGRLKTGTPPRLLRSSIDFSCLEKQEPEKVSYLFEFYPHNVTDTHACYITHTNAKTHEIIRNNLEQSAMYSGNISGTGPRYCPSIEDKISRFGHKDSHLIFVEPESASTDEMYPNGISTSLPLEVQKQYIQSIVGFENAIITKPGYAVEYDFVLPNQLKHSLELKKIPGLFLAGQINGTTGYEEAAGQGIIAGINAHQKAHNNPEFTLDRSESYIGVMIDDLVTLGIDEPYRMFTSRAERRLLLRQDNAFLRLTDKAHALGMIDEQLFADFTKEKQAITDTLAALRAHYTTTQLAHLFGSATYDVQLIKHHAPSSLSERALTTIHSELRYAPYLKRELLDIEKTQKYKELILPATFDYQSMHELSTELRQKLTRHTPATIAQAALIPGMTPAALSILIFKVRQHTGDIPRKQPRT